MPLSHVAGILSPDGGTRTVVGQPEDLRDNTLPGERLYVVPGFRIREPVPWGMIPAVIEAAQQQILKDTKKDNACGGCTTCCFLTYIAALNKPSRTHCRYCRNGLGCTNLANRPTECKVFQCTWLRSQKSAEPMPKRLRPDRCGVMFMDDTTNGQNDVFEVHVEEMSEVAQTYIDAEEAKGRRAKLITYYYGEHKAL